MACLHNYPLCSPNILLFDTLKTILSVLVRLIQAMESQFPRQIMRGEDEVSGRIILDGERWEMYFGTGQISDVDEHHVEAQSTHVEWTSSDDHDEQFEDLRNYVDDPDRAHMVSGHD